MLPVLTCVGEAEPKVSRRQDRRAGRRAGRGTLRGLDLHDSLAHRAHDPPTTRVGAQADGETSSDDHPQRRAGAGGLQVGGDQHERDHPHRLLAVRCPVCASATIDAVNACPYLNPELLCALGVFLVMR
jgi:hypothetical protein